ncbi:hypothetical protein E4U61_008008 [Claviceps capensis]|nr:hypothetical protein E4U61_008008 [Claviceps capensis]
MLGPNEDVGVIGNRNCKWKHEISTRKSISQARMWAHLAFDHLLTITLYRQLHARGIHTGAAAAKEAERKKLLRGLHPDKFWLFSVLAAMHIRAWAPSVRRRLFRGTAFRLLLTLISRKSRRLARTTNTISPASSMTRSTSVQALRRLYVGQRPGLLVFHRTRHVGL